MPIPANVWKYTYFGSLPGGEQWQSGIWWSGNAPTDNGSAQAAADLEMGIEAGSTASSWWGAVKNIYVPLVTLDGVKVQVYPDASGTAKFSGVSTHAAIVGTGANEAMPNQCAICVSLLTGAAGRSHRGRMYFPATAAPSMFSQVTAQLLPGGVDVLLNALAAMINDNAAIGQQAVVVSQKLGTFTPVTGVRCDLRVDVQRRRANRQNVAPPRIVSVT